VLFRSRVVLEEPTGVSKTPTIVETPKKDIIILEKLRGENMVYTGDKINTNPIRNSNDEPVWMNEKEVLDFYAGQNLAYEFPLWKDHSYHFIRGFVDVAESLLSSLKDELNKIK
jgi:hypothetical protein